MKLIVFSLVSHGHGEQVLCILRQLLNCQENPRSVNTIPIKCVLTINAAELEPPNMDRRLEALDRDFPGSLTVLRNKSPKGFGDNHNCAFAWCSTSAAIALQGDHLFCVLNPDIVLLDNPVPRLFEALQLDKVGLAHAKQTDAHGNLQDYARTLVTPLQIVKRHVLGRRSVLTTASVDWVNGAFMAFPARVYAELGGFDKRYFMYAEDVDICLRVQLAGYRLVQADATVLHEGQRRSSSGSWIDFQHLRWHVTSLLRLWCSKSFWRYVWQR